MSPVDAIAPSSHANSDAIDKSWSIAGATCIEVFLNDIRLHMYAGDVAREQVCRILRQFECWSDDLASLLEQHVVHRRDHEPDRCQ